MMIKPLHFKDRQSVLPSAKKLKGTNLYITSQKDFSEAVQLRKELLPKMKAARERGDKVSLK